MIRLALPTGDLRPATGDFLRRAGLNVEEYSSGSRSYAMRVEQENGAVQLRVFRERDIPIQIALGNYDLGICGLDWLEDLTQRYPTDALVPVRDLGFGRRSLYLAAASAKENDDSLNRWAEQPGLRIVSEYANLAEAFAMGLRLATYRVFPVWGAATAYPPEDAELAIVAAPDDAELRVQGLLPLHRLLDSSAWLVANSESLAKKNLGAVLDPLLALAQRSNGRPALSLPLIRPAARRRLSDSRSLERDDSVRLALPDGHQQKHAAAALEAAGLAVSGYGEGTAVARPQADLAGLALKVIRPQDMPQQVAVGHFDLAITGRDWLLDHRYSFPESPVEEVVDLGVGRYVVAAVASEDVPAGSLDEAIAFWRGQSGNPVRLASEYANIADHCARGHHLPRYKVIPIGGASEGFVPEDAELLIEGTETGATLAANRLKVIDVLFESTTCLISHRGPVPEKRRRLVEQIIEMFSRSAARREA